MRKCGFNSPLWCLTGPSTSKLKVQTTKKTQELQRCSPKKLEDLAASQLENIDIALWQHTVQQRGKVGPPWGPEITMNEILPPMHTHTHTHTCTTRITEGLGQWNRKTLLMFSRMTHTKFLRWHHRQLRCLFLCKPITLTVPRCLIWQKKKKKSEFLENLLFVVAGTRRSKGKDAFRNTSSVHSYPRSDAVLLGCFP